MDEDMKSFMESMKKDCPECGSIHYKHTWCPCCGAYFCDDCGHIIKEGKKECM